MIFYDLGVFSHVPDKTTQTHDAQLLKEKERKIRSLEELLNNSLKVQFWFQPSVHNSLANATTGTARHKISYKKTRRCMLKLELEVELFFNIHLVFLGLKATRGEIFDVKASPVAFTKLYI